MKPSEPGEGGSPLVSIIVPAYNASATLSATLESALAQTGSTVEIICIDDGSTDDTLQRAMNFSDRIRVLSGPNLGVSEARNRGFAESRGQWIVFLDADDLLSGQTIQSRVNLACSGAFDVIICNWRNVDGDGENPGSERSVDMALIEDDAELAFASTAWATTAALMYRRELVERIGGFRKDLPVIQDARFAFDAARSAARFGHSAHVGALYRIVEGSLSRRDPSRFYRDILTNTLQIEADWRLRGCLSARRLAAVVGSINLASRGLFRTGDQAYFEALAALRRFSPTLPPHARIAGGLAGLFGLAGARRVLSVFGKA